MLISRIERLTLRIRQALVTWVAGSRFQQRAAASLLTRPVARREARKLFDLAAGFVYSQVLAGCVRSGLLERLLEGPASVKDLAAALNLPEERLGRLLDAAAALQLVHHRAGVVQLGLSGASLLGNPGVLAMIRHNQSLYDDLRDPLVLLGTPGQPSPATVLGRFWSYAQPGAVVDSTVAASPEAAGARAGGPDEAAGVADYASLMSRSQAFIAAQILAAFRFGDCRHLLDVGGGEGVFAEAVARQYPHLSLVVFDLPEVAERARHRIEAEQLGGQISTVAGNFLTDALPTGADLVTLVRVLHDHDEPAALQILDRVREALPLGGRILVAEPMASGSATRGVEAYFACYFLAMGQGRLRTPAEITRLLEQSGFEQQRQLRTNLPLLTGAVTARRAA